MTPERLALIRELIETTDPPTFIETMSVQSHLYEAEMWSKADHLRVFNDLLVVDVIRELLDEIDRLRSSTAEPMTREKLLERLRSFHGENHDHEIAHSVADDALLAYINDPEITEAFEAIIKWYA